MSAPSIIELSIPIELDYSGVITSLIEKTSLAMGLGEEETKSLTLVADEIFSFLCREYASSNAVRIKCNRGGYFVRVDFIFPFAKLNLHTLNLTQAISSQDPGLYNEAGLTIVARAVDRFVMDYNRDKYICLSVIKNKEYPKPAPGRIAPAPIKGHYEIVAPDPEETKALSSLLPVTAGAECCPNSFFLPGKLVDMTFLGDYSSRIVRGDGGELGGCILWHFMTEKTIECFGPFIFDQPAAVTMSKELIESCLNAIARTKAQSLICRQTDKTVPAEYFEVLGACPMKRQDGTSFATTTYYRHIHEDTGSRVWSSPELAAYLRGEYDRLVFPRDIHIAQSHGELRGAQSIISATFDRDQSLITLNPVLSGTDNKANITAYQNVIRQKKILNTFFEIDLGLAWQTEFTPPLLDLGFKPRMVLPNAGTGDVVVFQWERV